MPISMTKTIKEKRLRRVLTIMRKMPEEVFPGEVSPPPRDQMCCNVILGSPQRDIPRIWQKLITDIIAGHIRTGLDRWPTESGRRGKVG
ncbi:MAG: hypothetical protein COV08_01825 [Candidatus Vogelbacteria bacterium CG10_big_fil_rev_8_21_14_0_10_49_38]|uniref:Uncharacterized protein n=1 Tax=Candidatus Vogelbacteria bacterium CG10_big_fil_rev_8_21_14_0_10_49_38 TaxID=1975043 RepID=A0A2H0RJN9_9BACT|nr:MAG: hypothetical protein BK006_01840 [bacterium CG10_49_38]PIR45995.1 MAG: hypothetical protein COV08_01825 [Candidatus Vogelbacteria bacterium CG10_big_fil_rev_8_21_14_0_10_49_38]